MSKRDEYLSYDNYTFDKKSPMSEIYTSENQGDPDAYYRRRKKEKKSILTEVFLHEGHRYRAYLSDKGIHWTRLATKGRKHFMDFNDVIGVVVPPLVPEGVPRKPKENIFKIVGVTDKLDKQGLRKPNIVNFTVLPEYTELSSDEVFKQWSNQIKKHVSMIRKPVTKKLRVVINPFSGKKEGVVIWKSMKHYFKIAGIEYKAIQTECQGHAYNIALNLDVNEYYGIVCVSGDGLLNEVLNGIIARKDYRLVIRDLVFGVIPAGSGNGLCGSLYAPDPFTASYGIICGRTHPLDIFSMIQSNERKFGFLNICWATMSVIDLESEGYRWLGPIRWDIKGIAEIATNYSYKGRISYIEVPSTEIRTRTQQELPPDNSKPVLNYIDDDDDEPDWVVLDGEWSFFIACNTTKAIVGPGELARYANLSDGCIDLILAPSLGRVELTALLLGIDNGSLVELPAVKYIKAKAFKLEPDQSQNARRAPISIDGEHTNNAAIKVELHTALIHVFFDYQIPKSDIDDKDSKIFTTEKDRKRSTQDVMSKKNDNHQHQQQSSKSINTKKPTTQETRLGTGLPKPSLSGKSNKIRQQIQASIQDRTLIATSQIKPEEIEIVDTLGVGSCATVYRGYWQHTEVAIKIINSKKSTKQAETLIDEANLMVQMRHPNVVPLYGAWLSKPILFLVTEYMARGDVYGILHNDDIVIERKHVQSIALDTCRGMTYLHSRNIIHRDLKTLNILVDSNWHVKVADFGLAREIEDAVIAQALTACGTTSWTAPEVLREQNYTLNADVYSFAICLWEMATRQEPYADLYAPQVVLAVAVEGKRLEIPDYVHKGIADIIREAWQEDPTRRPSFATLVDILTKLVFEEPTHPTPWSKKEEASKRQQQTWPPPAIILEE